MNLRPFKAGIAICVLATSSASLRAQAPAPPIIPASPPAGKLLAPAPESAQWTIDITAVPPANAKPHAASARPASSPPPQRVTVTKSGSVRHVTGVVFGGIVEELWIDGSTQVMISPGMERPVIFDLHDGIDPYFTRYCRADFPGFEWLSATNFAGMTNVGARKCFVFRTTAKVDAPVLDATGGTGPALAYIDAETRLPARLERDGQTLVFQFGDPPAQPISLPPEIAAAVTARKNHSRDLTKSPARPY